MQMICEWRRVAGAGAVIPIRLAPFLIHLALATGRYVPVAVVLSSLQAGLFAALLARQWMPGARSNAAWIGVGVGVVMLWLCAITARFGLSVESGVAHTMLYLTLLVVFARTLRAGRVPLVTSLAARLAGPRPPAMMAYTRSVTVAWAILFFGQLILSALLVAAAPLEIWSLFVNVLDLPLAVVMLTCEYAVRLHRFRDFPHVSIGAAIGAFSGGGFARRGPVELPCHVR